MIVLILWRQTWRALERVFREDSLSRVIKLLNQQVCEVHHVYENLAHMHESKDFSKPKCKIMKKYYSSFWINLLSYFCLHTQIEYEVYFSKKILLIILWVLYIYFIQHKQMNKPMKIINNLTWNWEVFQVSHRGLCLQGSNTFLSFFCTIPRFI